MSQSLKHMKSRIRIIDNIKKMSYAMEMIAVAKFKKLEDSLFQVRNYYKELYPICVSLLSNDSALRHMFLQQNKKSNKILLVVNSSDTGLCGSYNNNILKYAESFLKNKKEDFLIMPIGKKGANYFKYRGASLTRTGYIELHSKLKESSLKEITEDVLSYFLDGEVKEVYWAYTYFGGNMKYETKIEKILNIEFKEKDNREFSLDSNIENVLDNILPIYIETKIRLMLMESFVSEQSSRLVSMNMATTNAKDLLESLILEMNKTRQALITREVTEIVSSAEAMK
jgi:F-type H+-transporting ATPase subunit gamma